MVPEHFHDYEVMEIIENGYTKLYDTWGACLFRQWKVALNGFEYCSSHADPIIRTRSAFHRKIANEIFPMTRAMEVFAPNGTVRKRVRDQRNRFVDYFGAPSGAQKMMEAVVLRKARQATRSERESPINQTPKVEPFKRYDYSRAATNGGAPYTVTYPKRELAYQMHDFRRKARGAVFTGLFDAIAASPFSKKSAAPGKGDFVGRRLF